MLRDSDTLFGQGKLWKQPPGKGGNSHIPTTPELGVALNSVAALAGSSHMLSGMPIATRSFLGHLLGMLTAGSRRTVRHKYFSAARRGDSIVNDAPWFQDDRKYEAERVERKEDKEGARGRDAGSGSCVRLGCLGPGWRAVAQGGLGTSARRGEGAERREGTERKEGAWLGRGCWRPAPPAPLRALCLARRSDARGSLSGKAL